MYLWLCQYSSTCIYILLDLFYHFEMPCTFMHTSLFVIFVQVHMLYLASSISYLASLVSIKDIHTYTYQILIGFYLFQVRFWTVARHLPPNHPPPDLMTSSMNARNFLKVMRNSGPHCTLGWRASSTRPYAGNLRMTRSKNWCSRTRTLKTYQTWPYLLPTKMWPKLSQRGLHISMHTSGRPRWPCQKAWSLCCPGCTTLNLVSASLSDTCFANCKSYTNMYIVSFQTHCRLRLPIWRPWMIVYVSSWLRSTG